MHQFRARPEISLLTSQDMVFSALTGLEEAAETKFPKKGHGGHVGSIGLIVEAETPACRLAEFFRSLGRPPALRASILRSTNLAGRERRIDTIQPRRVTT